MKRLIARVPDWMVFPLLLFISMTASASYGRAAIVDNTDIGFTTVGAWGSSSFTPGYYGSSYRYAAAGGGNRQAVWVFSVADGQYELSARWAAFENRASNANYQVRNNGAVIDTQVFDQRVNGGVFNPFDVSYSVSAGTLEIVLSDAADGYVIADAVQAEFIGAGGNLAPNGVIGSPSGSVIVNEGTAVNFSGAGTDPDGDLPLAYEWDFGDPAIADAFVAVPGEVVFGIAGTYTVSLTVRDNLGLVDPTPATVVVEVVSAGGPAAIIDNTDSGFTAVGAWGSSSFTPGYYGSSYRYTASGSGSRQAVWAFAVADGQYALSAQWAAFENRASNASYRVRNNGVLIGTQVFDQRVDGGVFNPFDTPYSVSAGTLEIVLTDAGDGYVIADAVQAEFIGAGGNLAPNGMIGSPSGSVVVNEGAAVNFSGTGTDPDGDLPLAYEWDFGDPAIADAFVAAPGEVVFGTAGTYTVSLTVRDNLGLVDPTPATVVVEVVSAGGPAAIIDNTDSGFTAVGAWGSSSFTPGYYGSSYRYTASGSGSRQAVWAFAVADGQYALSAQWAAFENRASNASYRVRNNGVLIGTQVFDQRVDGGVFNPFDTAYSVSAGILEIVLTDAGDGYVIADAVQAEFIGAGGNLPPNGVIGSPSGSVIVNEGTAVNFSGTGTDPDGDLPLAYEWDFGDPAIADAFVAAPGEVVFGTTGIYTVSLTVRDSLGLADPTPATVVIEVMSAGGPAAIIDNTDSGFSTVGPWGASSFTPGYYGADYRYIGNVPGANSATWSVNLPEGRYEVFAQWASFDNRATNAKYSLINNGMLLGDYWADQTMDGGQFNSLGVFFLEGGGLEVALSELIQSNGLLVADAVRIDNLCQADPCVYLKAPQNFHLQPGALITATAVVQTQDAIANFGVRFVLDEATASEQSFLDLSAPFEADFSVPIPSAFEHRIDAYLTDAGGTPLAGVSVHDAAVNIGVGNYMVAMGNSTTAGVGDDDTTDDVSLDMRNGGGGYPPILNDLLTAAREDVPQTVINEGVPGALSADGAAMITALIAKHPLAEFFLVQYGINDSGTDPPVESGFGLNPGDTGYAGSFKANLQQIINAVNLAGKEVAIAMVPIILGGDVDSGDYADPDIGARNLIIKGYNEVVNELYLNAANGISVPPPDLYATFNEVVNPSTGERRYELEYSDNFHANGQGYRTMAGEWLDALLGN